MKKIIIFLVCFSVILSAGVFAQQAKDTTKIAKNTIYTELIGFSYYYSINYDRLLFCKNKFKIAARIGVSFFPNLNNNISIMDVFSFPFEVDLLYGKKHHLEVGFGGKPLIKVYSSDLLKVYDNYISYGLRIGYRYQRPAGGFFFKFDIVPIVLLPRIWPNEEKFLVIPPIGFGIGKSF